MNSNLGTFGYVLCTISSFLWFWPIFRAWHPYVDVNLKFDPKFKIPRFSPKLSTKLTSSQFNFGVKRLYFKFEHLELVFERFFWWFFRFPPKIRPWPLLIPIYRKLIGVNLWKVSEIQQCVQIFDILTKFASVDYL